MSYQILDPLIKQEKCEHVKNIGTLKQNIGSNKMMLQLL